MKRPAKVLMDIEGTTTPIAFVRDVLFPYARARLPAFLRQYAGCPDVAAEVAAIERIAPGMPPIDVALGWMDRAEKTAPLKNLQGMVWRQGYQEGSLVGSLYPDVAPALRRWHAAGIRLAVFSSGSVLAQRLLFRHSAAGDLTPLFDGFYDLELGNKREPGSYERICGGAGAGWLFLSDMEAELNAAEEAGLAVFRVVRAADGTAPSSRHPQVEDLYAAEARWTN